MKQTDVEKWLRERFAYRKLLTEPDFRARGCQGWRLRRGYLIATAPRIPEPGPLVKWFRIWFGEPFGATFITTVPRAVAWLYLTREARSAARFF